MGNQPGKEGDHFICCSFVDLGFCFILYCWFEKNKQKQLMSICSRERHVFKIPRAFDKPLPLQNHTPATV